MYYVHAELITRHGLVLDTILNGVLRGLLWPTHDLVLKLTDLLMRFGRIPMNTVYKRFYKVEAKEVAFLGGAKM